MTELEELEEVFFYPTPPPPSPTFNTQKSLFVLHPYPDPREIFNQRRCVPWQQEVSLADVINKFSSNETNKQT